MTSSCPDTVNCIVRFYDISKLMELDRCIFSLVTQHYSSVHIIVVLQRFTADEELHVHNHLQGHTALSAGSRLTIVNFNQQEPADARVWLLNEGIKHLQGRYLAFLDYDELLFPEAYKILVRQLREKDAGIAFASIQPMEMYSYSDFVYTSGTCRIQRFSGSGLLDLFRNNFCPLNSYLLDLQKVPREEIYFDTRLNIEGDYDFLLRICSRTISDFSRLPTVIGYCFHKSDENNTRASDQSTEAFQQKYDQIVNYINQQKQRIVVSPRVQEHMQLSFQDPSRTIADILQEQAP